jgi:hypothetical protein
LEFSALTSPTYSKTEIVKIELLRMTIAGRKFDRFKNILFLSYHRLSRLSPKKCKATAKPCGEPIVYCLFKFIFCSHKATAGIEPAEQKVWRAYHFKIKEIIEPFVAIKGITPFSKKYIGAYQPLADNIIIPLN